ncbi:hypothetical protein OAB63_00200 [Alphaproteobacteria bacterium]|nr:hypothetical protein [Alphaproteobacteria bacterium]
MAKIAMFVGYYPFKIIINKNDDIANKQQMIAESGNLVFLMVIASMVPCLINPTIKEQSY